MDAANHGTGRGNVRIVQLGPKDEPNAAPKPGKTVNRTAGRPAVPAGRAGVQGDARPLLRAR